MAPGAESAVRLEHDAPPAALLEERPAVLERAELCLVDDGRGARRGRELLELVDAEVRDPDRSRAAELARSLHSRPGPRGTTLRPVDDVEVDLVDAEPPQAVLRRGRRVLVPRIELGGEEDLLARHAALAKPLADALLVAVRLRGVDVPVAELECPPHGVHALGPVGHLPDAEPEHRDPVV